MRTQTEREQVNRFLGRAGLAQLDEPAALVAQLGYLVRDHEHFRNLLTKCEPEMRYQMYEAMVPNLRFEAKTLGDYLIEAAQLAERKQLPTVAPDGTLLPFRPPELETEEYIAERAIAEDIAKKRLWLVCRKCTREEVFSGERKADCVSAARAAGWTYDELNGNGKEICPVCMDAIPGQPRERSDADILLLWMRGRGAFTPAEAAEATGIDPVRVLQLLARFTKKP